jgi:hypothetical protein
VADLSGHREGAEQRREQYAEEFASAEYHQLHLRVAEALSLQAEGVEKHGEEHEAEHGGEHPEGGSGRPLLQQL